jgi:hypothetical protein
LLLNVAENKREKKGLNPGPDSEYIELTDCVGKKDEEGPFNKVFFEHPNSALDFLNVARILFDEREYQNCANILQPYCLPPPVPEGNQQVQIHPAFYQTNTA